MRRPQATISSHGKGQRATMITEQPADTTMIKAHHAIDHGQSHPWSSQSDTAMPKQHQVAEPENASRRTDGHSDQTIEPQAQSQSPHLVQDRQDHRMTNDEYPKSPHDQDILWAAERCETGKITE